MNEVLPNFCYFLHACRENQYIIIPREEASANSFYGLGQMAITVLTHVSGQRYVPMAD
jgi:iron complex transport system substrate-binding protein